MKRRLLFFTYQSLVKVKKSIIILNAKGCGMKLIFILSNEHSLSGKQFGTMNQHFKYVYPLNKYLLSTCYMPIFKNLRKSNFFLIQKNGIFSKPLIFLFQSNKIIRGTHKIARMYINHIIMYNTKYQLQLKYPEIRK